MVDSSMMPMLGYLVDIRHTSVYGSVYAIGDVAFCVGFVVGMFRPSFFILDLIITMFLFFSGPALSGSLVRTFGFRGLVNVSALICFAFAPFMYFLKKPPGKNENQSLMQESSVRYVNYTNDETTPEEEGNIRKTNPPNWVP